MHRLKPAISLPDRSRIEALMRPAAFTHPVKTIKMVETHISWVILTDRYAYKIKKPIVLDFLDFGSIEKRKFFCEEEVRLNKPFAPEIYIDVVPVNRSNDQINFNGTGDTVDYAVRMHRFDQKMRLDAQLADGELTVTDMKEIGQVVAARHGAAERVDKAERERHVAAAKRFIFDNFTALDGVADGERLQALSDWSRRQLQRLEPMLWRRFDDGFVRDCHGDLHLANLVRLPAGIATFDCIEFDSDLRHIDVMCDIAFLVMDLAEKQRHDLAYHFLNRYLECTGDYAGVSLLDLYFVYRCLVRAKVAAISSQECADSESRERHLAETRRYCEIAWQQASKGPPVLVVMHGLSGSGKTWLSGQLMAALPAIRVRSDTERKRLFSLHELADSASGISRDLYSQSANRETYACLLEHAGRILSSGHSVILDAAFLHKSDRMDAMRVAETCNCDAYLLHARAPVEILRQRVAQRATAKNDPSEAGLEVLEHQLLNADPPAPDEAARTIICDTIDDLDVATIVAALSEPRRQARQSNEN